MFTKYQGNLRKTAGHLTSVAIAVLLGGHTAFAITATVDYPLFGSFTDSVTFTGIGTSQVDMILSPFSRPEPGHPGVTDNFGGGTFTLLEGGSFSGFSGGTVGVGGPIPNMVQVEFPVGPPPPSGNTWVLSGIPGNETLTLSGTEGRCLFGTPFCPVYSSGSVSITAGSIPAPVPEPASLLLLGAGLSGMGLWRLRRRNTC